MAVEVFANDALGTVTSGGTTAPSGGTVQTWTVSVTNAFPAASSSATPATSFYVCDQLTASETEKILVTNISGTTWTVTRGADGTTPVTHIAGFTIVQVATRATLQALQAPWRYSPSGDATGAADVAAINSLVTAYGLCEFIAGTYYINAPLIIGNNQSLLGAGRSTLILQTSGFTGTAMVKIQGPQATVSGIQFGAPSATTASNPVSDCILLDNSGSAYLANFLIADVLINGINGWGVHFPDNGSSGAPVDGTIRNVFGYANGGIGIVAATPRTYSLRLEGCAIACDLGHATLDSFLLENVFDADLSDCYGGGNSATAAGNGLHLNGHCSAVRVRGGEFSANNVASGSGVCGLLIDDSGTGAVMCEFTDTVFQTADLGVSLQGACREITFTGCDIQNNNLNGAVVNTSSNDIRFNYCRFGTQASNGQHNPSSTVYDLKWSSSAHGSADGCWFNSGIVASGSVGVQGSVDFGFGGEAVWLRDPMFLASGSTTSNQVTNRPQYIRAPLIVGTATLSGSGTATVSASYITAVMRIEVRYLTPGGTPGAVFVSAVTAGTGFTIKSTSSTDTSTVEYEVFQ